MTAEKIKAKQINPKKPSKKQIAAMVLHGGCTQEEVAEVAGICQQRVSQIIQEVNGKGEIEIFREQKDKILEGLQYQIIDNVTGDDIQKANLQQKIWSIGVLEDKVRNIRGLATEVHDVQIRALIAQIQPTSQDKIADGNDSNVST